MDRPFRCWMLQTPWNHVDDRTAFPEIDAAASRAKEFGLSALMLTEVNLHTLVTYRGFPKLNLPDSERRSRSIELTQQFCRTCRAHDLEPYLFCFELLELKRIAESYPEAADPNGSLLWEITAERVRNTFELYPELAGIEVYVDEGPTVNVSHLGQYHMPAREIVARLAYTYLRVCGEYGRTFIFSTFTNEPYRLRDIQEGLKLVPLAPGFFVNNWVVPGDWGEYLAHNPAVGDVGGHPEIITFDFAAENWGQCQLPFCAVDFIHARWQDAVARSANVIGYNGWALWSWHYGSRQGRPFILDSPNEINAFAMSRLVDDPGLSTDEIWDSWLSGITSDLTAAATVKAALQHTQPIGELAWMVKGFWFMEFPKSQLPGIRGLLHSPYNESTAEWDARLRPIEDAIFIPTQAFVESVVQDRETAIELAERSLAEVRKASPLLSPPWGEALPASLERLVAFCRTSRWTTELFLRWKLWWFRRPGGDYEAVERCARALQALADELEACYGPDLWPANPVRIRIFVRQIEQMMAFGQSPVASWSGPFLTPLAKRYTYIILDLLGSLTEDAGGGLRQNIPQTREGVLEEVERLTQQLLGLRIFADRSDGSARDSLGAQ